jgi:hypothetical protein
MAFISRSSTKDRDKKEVSVCPLTTVHYTTLSFSVCFCAAVLHQSLFSKVLLMLLLVAVSVAVIAAWHAAQATVVHEIHCKLQCAYTSTSLVYYCKTEYYNTIMLLITCR